MCSSMGLVRMLLTCGGAREAGGTRVAVLLFVGTSRFRSVLGYWFGSGEKLAWVLIWRS